MNGRKLLREIPWGLAVLVLVGGISGYLWYRKRDLIPPSVPPTPGQTLTAAEAAPLHPKLPPPNVDPALFAKLPPECGCTLSTGAVSLRMHVTGQNQTVTPSGSTISVTHDVAIAKELDGGVKLAKFPPLDVAPNKSTEGFAVRFDLACVDTRMLVADAVRVTLWDLKANPRKLWSTPFAARRGEVATGTSLAIECHAAKIEDQTVVIDPKGANIRIKLADGSLER